MLSDCSEFPKICISFPDIAAKMASHLRKFVTSPLPIFELEFAGGARTPPPLVAAAKCLALCIDVSELSHDLDLAQSPF